MLTTMTKRVSRQQLYIYGDLTSSEVYEYKQDGWKIEQRDKPQGKHGISQEGARAWHNADDVGGGSKRRRASKPGTGRSANGNMNKRRRSS